MKIAVKKEQISDINMVYELKTNKKNKEDRQHTVKNQSQIVYKCLIFNIIHTLVSIQTWMITIIKLKIRRQKKNISTRPESIIKVMLNILE